MSEKIHIFTHHDLDGICSLLILTWAFVDKQITYTTISSPHSFAKEYNDWCAKTPIKSFSKIFVTDLSLLPEDIKLIDKKNTLVFDHHKTSLDLKFQHANTLIKDYSSCSLLLYKTFKNTLHLTEEQKILIALVDDYDSYTLKHNLSKKLNTLFWSMYNTKINQFLNDFENGFKSFSEIQKKILINAETKLNALLDNLTVYEAFVPIQGKKCMFLSTFADTSINDVSDYIFNKYNPDIVSIVNIKNERVSFRRNKNINIDVSVLAKQLCDGGGHAAAAGGNLTDRYITFSRMLTLKQ